VLRFGGEGSDVLPADAEEHARAFNRQGGNGGWNIRNLDPVIALHFGPWRSRKRDQGRVRRRASGNRVAAYLGCEGMRRINHVGDFFASDVVGEPVRAAETAGAGRQRLIEADLRPSGIGIDCVEAFGCNRGCQSIGVARSAQNEGACHG